MAAETVSKSARAMGRPNAQPLCQQTVVSAIQRDRLGIIQLSCPAVVVLEDDLRVRVGDQSFSSQLLCVLFFLVCVPNQSLWTLMGAGVSRLFAKPAHRHAFNYTMAGLLLISLVGFYVQ